MNASTILSAKGQVVIPKDVRDALGLKPGQQLSVTQTGSGVLLMPLVVKSGRTAEEILDHLSGTAPVWPGPPVSVEAMDNAIAAMFTSRDRDDI